MFEYLGIAFTFAVAIGLAALLLVIPKLIAPKSTTQTDPFECGKEPFSLPHGRMPIHFYLVAMFFIIFDVEMVFFFPWAVMFRKLGVFGLIEMAVFMGFVVLGFVYVLKKKALEWEK